VPSDQEVLNIIELAHRMDLIREYLNTPIIINCWCRPTSVNDNNGPFMGKNYNALPDINGALNSAHIYGQASDSHPVGMSIDDAMSKLTSKCNEFKVAMENNGSKTGRYWLHTQSRILSDGTYRVYDIK
jgi:hypothetical protein